MTGAPPPSPLIARAGFALRRRPGRSEFLPVRLTQRGATLWAERTGPDGAARLLPLLAADGLACIPPECAALAPGSPVDVMPFAKEWL
jgi:molybdopterin molybdotransferase